MRSENGTRRTRRENGTSRIRGENGISGMMGENSISWMRKEMVQMEWKEEMAQVEWEEKIDTSGMRGENGTTNFAYDLIILIHRNDVPHKLPLRGYSPSVLLYFKQWLRIFCNALIVPQQEKSR